MECPVIDSIQTAIAFGQALGDVLHYDRGWCERVYNGSPELHWNTGPDVLNREIQEQWRGYWTQDQKEKIMARFVMYRLGH